MKTDDSIMFFANGEFGKLISVDENEDGTVTYKLRRYITQVYRPAECPDLTFSYLHLKKMVRLSKEEEVLDVERDENKVVGKGVLSEGLLIAIPNGIFMEEL